MCGRVGEAEEEEDTDDLHEAENDDRSGTFHWTPAIQNEFREELEKLIILGTSVQRSGRPYEDC